LRRKERRRSLYIENKNDSARCYLHKKKHDAILSENKAQF